MGAIRRVDPTRPPGLLRRLLAAVASLRPWLFVSRHVNWYLDPWLLRVTGGRVASTLVIPTGLLETRGARSGERRRNAIIYFNDVDQDRLIIAASNAGSARNPAWYHNLLAHPEVTFNGVPMQARPVDPDQHPRIWALADNVFPAFAKYRRTAAAAGRTIPLVELTARPEG